MIAAISWLNSYTLYSDVLRESMVKMASEEFVEEAAQAMSLLQEEAELEEIVRLVGKDSLSSADRLTLEVARSIREDFLHQNAFHEVDTYTSLEKQAMMLAAILHFHREARAALGRGADVAAIERLEVRDRIARMKYLSEDEAETEIGAVRDAIDQVLRGLGAA